jgi:hypothetical protein
MRLVIDLRPDTHGRPVGTVRIDKTPKPEPFSDWLDLLRVLEACIEQHRQTRGTGIEP